MITNIPQFLFIEMPGGGELLIILVVVLLLFGGKKIPELMRGLGKGMREFNDAKGKVTSELEEGMKAPEPKVPVSHTYPVSEEPTYTPHIDTPLPTQSSNGQHPVQ
ncbi:MAG: twin-arginine translocase TatA/TatE family subunit [Chitinophagaceae bacterium]